MENQNNLTNTDKDNANTEKDNLKNQGNKNNTKKMRKIIDKRYSDEK